MIILNLFIGIIMNSMAEMHAEIENRDRMRHVAETGAAILEDDLRLLERQIESLKEQAIRVRHRVGRPVPVTRQADFNSTARVINT
jgi:poly(3-hydroxyalkanoate) synthetase